MTIEQITEIYSAFMMLHNEKRAVHNIAVYCEERYAEKKIKRNHVIQIFRKRISEY